MARKYLSPESSTTRRKRLADFVSRNRTKMVCSCDNCFLNGRECRVHLRSSYYAECLRRDSRYNIRITYHEFEQLQEERDKLIERIERNCVAVQAAIEKQKKLNKSLHNIKHREAEAIAVEEADILENEGNMARSELMLSPLTQNASASLPDKFQENGTTELNNQGVAFAATVEQTSTVSTGSYSNS